PPPPVPAYPPPVRPPRDSSPLESRPWSMSRGLSLCAALKVQWYTNGRRQRLTRRIAVSGHAPPLVSLSVRSAPSTIQVGTGSGRPARDRRDAAGGGSSPRGSKTVGEYRGVRYYGPGGVCGESCPRRNRAA